MNDPFILTAGNPADWYNLMHGAWDERLATWLTNNQCTDAYSIAVIHSAVNLIK